MEKECRANADQCDHVLQRRRVGTGGRIRFVTMQLLSTDTPHCFKVVLFITPDLVRPDTSSDRVHQQHNCEEVPSECKLQADLSGQILQDQKMPSQLCLILFQLSI